MRNINMLQMLPTSPPGRYYNAEEGRYYTVDMLDSVIAGERYSYVLNNPMSNVDPLGLLAMKISMEGVKFIAKYEGFGSKPYNDPSDYATIGYGHLIGRRPVNDEDLKKWGCLNKEQGINLLNKDLQQRVNAVNRLVKVSLTQNQFDALVSFVFNAGEGRFQRGILKKINTGDLSDVPSEMNTVVYSGGKKLPGLVRRRKEEGDLFMKPDVVVRAIGKPLTPCECQKALRSQSLKNFRQN